MNVHIWHNHTSSDLYELIGVLLGYVTGQMLFHRGDMRVFYLLYELSCDISDFLDEYTIFHRYQMYISFHYYVLSDGFWGYLTGWMFFHIYMVLFTDMNKNMKFKAI